jgi:polyhydroxybutyrate depolymerase
MSAKSPSPGPGDHPITLAVGGVKRRYLVHVPPASAGLGPYPVVLMLHGLGATARWTLTETGWGDQADRAGFLAVFPEGAPPDPSKPVRFRTNPPFWNAGRPWGTPQRQAMDDVAFVGAVLDDVSARFPVDPRRVYVTGFSNGARMTFRLGEALGGRLAAIAPVAGHCPQENPRLEHPRPTLFLVGTADPLAPLAGGQVTSPWGTHHAPPVTETLAKWAAALGCPPEPATRRTSDGVEVLAYRPSNAGAELLVDLIEGLGHHWPGGKGQLAEAIAGRPRAEPRATEVIWDFFRRHPRP